MGERVLVEACVESLDEARLAERAGADRLELCERLDVGGVTPEVALVRAVRAAVSIPVFVMVRPRPGDFVYAAAEIDAMRRQIDDALAAGADGIVLGALNLAHEIDAPLLRELVRRAANAPVTFHRAVDALADQQSGVDRLIDAGVSRVLTSGGSRTALEGAERLSALVEHVRGRLVVMAGGSVRGHNAAELVRRGRVRELHARCGGSEEQVASIVKSVRERRD